MRDEDFMRMALCKAREGVALGQSPFGACIVRAGAPIACVHNRVFGTTDATAHAEIVAIREACRRLGAIDLAGCTIYSTTEPCPMCFSAIHWAHIDRIVFGASIADAADAGFRELSIANAQMKSMGGATLEIAAGVLREECAELFREYLEEGGKTY